ncbi:MAG: hypothetical protein F6K31_11320 [Symploca sp. SIO2G7]|nr:hypothetical protein [Symploca sp. SIO2G7]
MPKFSLPLNGAATIALLLVATGCSQTSLPKLNFNNNANTRNVVANEPNPPSVCPPINPFTKGISKANNAATLSQTAQSQQEWDLVVLRWIQAIEGMQAVPLNSPKRTYAQKKVVEYLNALDLAQKKASSTPPSLPFASFNNQIFDEQLLLYLSYVATFGPPDVLIVGSSRALVGIDPRQLEGKLATQGKGNLKVFNFGINGATGQMVAFQLRQLLTTEQLPKLIIWADGVRSFNSGRVDRTYQNLVGSQGYQVVMAGNRPTLPPAIPEVNQDCGAIPDSTVSQTTPQKSEASVKAANSSGTSEGWRVARVPFETSSNPEPSSTELLFLTQLTGTSTPQRLTLVKNTSGNSYSTVAIDANGFLPLESRFNPNTYYQNHPRVAGIYDGDYQPFSFSGPQWNALNSVKAFAQQRQIPLVVVNLPISQSYLDWERSRREVQFEKLMRGQAGLTFIDMGRLWLNQNQYFADPSHLNRYGAAAVASFLASHPNIPWPQLLPPE